MAAIYRNLAEDNPRMSQVTEDVCEALARGGVLAASLAKRAAGYTSLGFPDPRHIPHTPSSRAAREITDSLA